MKKLLKFLKGLYSPFVRLYFCLKKRILDWWNEFDCASFACNALVVAAFIFLACGDIYAQSSNGGFQTATSTIKGYKDDVANLMKAIGAVIAIVGAFTVYYKMQNGDQDVKKTIMLVLGGCIAFVALGEALPAFFE